MEQHPVPQPITSYEFRLVGDMTLKQFAKLASGIILALIVYGIDPPALIKWFFIFLFTLTGVAMAFLPFEGRPIDVWILAFFKRIYSPTQYIWRQKGKPELTPNVSPPPAVVVPPLVKTVSSPVSFSPPVSVSPPPPQPLPQPLPPLSSPPPATAFTPIPVQTKTETTFKPVVLPYIPPPSAQARHKPVEALFRPEVVLPTTPTAPNFLVGFVHDKENRIIEGAILEIRETNGNPVRAFKTNKLGQFQSATPLPNAEYEIETEREGFSFDIIRVNLAGTIIPPIEIISK